MVRVGSAERRPPWLEKGPWEAGQVEAAEKSWDLSRDNLEQQTKDFSSALSLEVLTRRLAPPGQGPRTPGTSSLVDSGGGGPFDCSVCTWFSVEVFCGLLCFLAFPFPYSSSQHMVLIMCWKSRQAAGQTATSHTESSKSSATSKVSATPRAPPPSLRPARRGPAVGASPRAVWLSVANRFAHLEGRPLLGLTDCTWNSTLATLVRTVI